MIDLQTTLSNLVQNSAEAEKRLNEWDKRLKIYHIRKMKESVSLEIAVIESRINRKQGRKQQIKNEIKDIRKNKTNSTNRLSQDSFNSCMSTEEDKRKEYKIINSDITCLEEEKERLEEEKMSVSDENVHLL